MNPDLTFALDTFYKFIFIVYACTLSLLCSGGDRQHLDHHHRVRGGRSHRLPDHLHGGEGSGRSLHSEERRQEVSRALTQSCSFSPGKFAFTYALASNISQLYVEFLVGIPTFRMKGDPNPLSTAPKLICQPI